MKIISLYGDFGRLHHETLTFHEGLNIIELPNEGGKSTWCALLRAMLYGIDSKERDKIGSLAEKNRYAPWNGAPMAGVLECEHDGRRIRIRRGADKKQPFALLSVEDMDTQQPIPALMVSNLGEQLTGVSRAVFERTCFIPQGQMTVSHSGELEKRIASLIQSGDEDASASAALKQLKDWRNRRERSGTGLIHKLEASLAEVRSARAMQSSKSSELEQAQEELVRCQENIAALQAEQRAHQALAQQALAQRVEQANSAHTQAQQQVEALRAAQAQEEPLDPLFAEKTAQEALAQVQRDVAQVEAQQRARAAAEQQQQAREKQARICSLIALVLLALGLVGIAAPDIALPIALIPFVSSFCLSAVAFARRKQTNAQPMPQENLLYQYDAVDTRDMHYRASAYVEALTKREQARAAHAQQLAAAEETAAQLQDAYQALAAQLAEMPPATEAAAPPKRSAQDTAAMLRMAKSREEQLLREVSRAQGNLETRADLTTLIAQEDELKEQLRARRAELEAIKLAQEQLMQADASMRERFSPAINQRAAQYFSALTDGAWSDLRLDSDFTAQVMEQQQARGALFLSAGTMDQLYLAVRLAICALTYDSGELPPLILDDALVQFDDHRLQLALKTLAQFDGQVLLFTCQAREAAHV